MVGMKRSEMKRSEMKRRAWPTGEPGSNSGSEPGFEADQDPDSASSAGAGPELERGSGLTGQARLDAQRGFEPEFERGQAWLDAQRGFRPEVESLSGQARLDAERGYRATAERVPASADADQALFSRPDPKPGSGQPGSGQAGLDARRGFQSRRRSRPEPRYSRNDPERPIGYDPERWAGLEPEADVLPGRPGGRGTAGSGGLPGEDAVGSAEDRAEDQGNGSGSGRRTGPAFGQSSGLGSGRRSGRSDRPKRPRPERSPEERAERTAQRQARAAQSVAADPTAAAKSVVLRQLTLGPRTRAQLRQAMADKDIPEDVVNAVLDRFEQVDLIDDKEFSRQWVQSRHLGRGLARRALAHELRQRGVDDEIVKDAVDEVSPDDELSAARELVRRKAAGTRNDDPQRRIRRLAGMLARKGYDGGIAMQAIRAELADLADAADEAGLDFDPDAL